MCLNRYSSLVFRNGKTARNRVVIPPMASGTAGDEGGVTDVTLKHYDRLLDANPGITFVEYTYVEPYGKSEPHQLGLWKDEHTEKMKDLASLIKRRGSIAGIQLTHAGGKTTSDLIGCTPMSPSGIKVPSPSVEYKESQAMNLNDIELWKQSFLSAVKRAAAAGFDIVEFHAAHGYGLNQWLSPLTNRRTDSYGVTSLNRAKLLFEILQNAKSENPGLLFSVRLPGQDFFEGGLTQEDCIEIAKELEKLGVDIIDISSGIGGWRRPKERTGEGYLVLDAAVIQSKVSVPVIGVGGIETGDFIDKALCERKLSLAAVGRAILSAPIDWGEKNLSRHLPSFCLATL